MFFPLTRQLTRPTALPLTLAEAAAQLRIPLDETSQDASMMTEVAYVQDLLRACAEWWEAGTDTALMRAEYVTVYAGFGSELRGLKTPVGELLSLTYATDADVNTAGLTTDYQLSEGRPGVALYTLSTDFPDLRRGYAEPVRVRYTAGYATPEDVPALIKQAIRLTLAHWYENRQNVVVGLNIAEVPQTAVSILKQFRDPVL
ncbi:head-tail connector protein [Hymenobacter guriensis]|uniref:Phage gp6-like head-tail connector protein n=1 Tax=Hymenobacter guriensis TaxID=2793065 RepID=A0ABS0KWW7_9BACT|nr:head-tail connector protein [Hymenobacter guriensis]MBG8552352.1 hypothetical protein [Hymenobacter guriensis]